MTEKLIFKIVLDSTWDKEFHENPPKASVNLNLTEYYNDYVFEETIIEFEHNCDQDNSLIISLLEKGPGDVKIDPIDGIIIDKLLNIKSIEIDRINITNLCRTQSYYHPTDDWYIKAHGSEPLQNHTDLGLNGEWHFEFTTPWYSFLLEII